MSPGAPSSARFPELVEDGFAVRGTSRGVEVRKSAPPLSHGLMLWAFLLVAPFLVAGALLTAVTGVFGLIEPGRDPGYRLAFVTVLLLGLGGVAFMLWWTKGLLVLALPVRYEVARSGDTATYSVTLAGVRIRRRRIPLPLEVLEEVYEGRDGWTYRIGVLDGKGRRHELVIPTASGGRDSTARKASRLAERIATPLGAEVRSAS